LQKLKTHFEQVPLEKVREMIVIQQKELTEETRNLPESSSDRRLWNLTMVIEEE